MSWTLTTSGAAIAKAGAGVSTAAKDFTTLTQWSDHAEGTLGLLTRKNWVSSITSYYNFSGALNDVASDMIAMEMISYDTSGYTNAPMMLDRLRDKIMRSVDALKDDKHKEIMN